MKKIKKMYHENRILLILLIIVIICVVVMGVALFNYFYSGLDKSKYGDRLEGIEAVEITTSRQSDLTTKLKEDSLINDAEIIISGKIVYTYLTYTNDASLTEAQTKALAFLDEFSDEEKSFYDFEFTLIQNKTEENDGFLISGSKTASRPTIVWNNNNVAPVEESEK